MFDTQRHFHQQKKPHEFFQKMNHLLEKKTNGHYSYSSEGSSIFLIIISTCCSILFFCSINYSRRFLLSFINFSSCSITNTSRIDFMPSMTSFAFSFPFSFTFQQQHWVKNIWKFLALGNEKVSSKVIIFVRIENYRLKWLKKLQHFSLVSRNQSFCEYLLQSHRTVELYQAFKKLQSTFQKDPFFLIKPLNKYNYEFN